MRVLWQPERHDGKLCGTEEQAHPSIRSSQGRFWRGDKTHQLYYSLSRWHWTSSGLELTVCRATPVYYCSQYDSISRLLLSPKLPALLRFLQPLRSPFFQREFMQPKGPYIFYNILNCLGAKLCFGLIL